MFIVERSLGIPPTIKNPITENDQGELRCLPSRGVDVGRIPATGGWERAFECVQLRSGIAHSQCLAAGVARSLGLRSEAQGTAPELLSWTNVLWEKKQNKGGT